MPLHICDLLLVTTLLLRHAASTDSLEIFPASVTGGIENVVNFIGASEGDQVEFVKSGSCSAVISASEGEAAYELRAVGEAACSCLSESACQQIARHEGKKYSVSGFNKGQRPCGCFYDGGHPSHVFYNSDPVGGNLAHLPLQQYCESQAPFVYGGLGIDACPTGYEPIRDEQTCLRASQHLGDPYNAKHNDAHHKALCNGFHCGAEYEQGSGCTGTRLSANHGGVAQWICQAMPSHYVDGPLLDNHAFQGGNCEDWYGPLGAAIAKCDASRTCFVLHDYECDGGHWRLCEAAILEKPPGDRKACTKQKAIVSATVYDSMARFAFPPVPASSQTTTYELCYKSYNAVAPSKQSGVTLSVVSPTSSTAITGFHHRTLIAGIATLVTFSGPSGLRNGKVIFIPKEMDCSTAEPDVVLDLHLRVTILLPIDAKTGTYKLCYRAAGHTDVVLQTSAGDLEVKDKATTTGDRITSIFPSEVTADVPTLIKFDGANLGDKAIFARDGEMVCKHKIPVTDVGHGYAMFTFGALGDYSLCYTVAGAADSKLQTSKATKLKVRPKGATQAMINRWQSKNGAVDCNSIDYVSHCGAATEDQCNTAYMVRSGIGYKCYWETANWPPRCAMEDYTASNSICRSGTCSNNACW